MFEKFLSINAGDFRQRYEGTYGFYQSEEGKKMFCRLDSISLAPPFRVHFSDVRGVTFSLNADAVDSRGFTFVPPKSAYYNTEKGCYYIQRIAARQFQRGVSGKNTAVFLITKDGFLPVKVGFESLSYIYEKTMSFAEAFTAFNENKIPSIALSQCFSLTKDGKVYLYADQLGNWAMKEGVYKLGFKGNPNMWSTEILDAFHRNGIFNVEIVNNAKA